MKTIKKLFRLQTASLKTFQTKFGYYSGQTMFILLHSSKVKGNIVLLYLYCNSDERKQLDRFISGETRKRNVKLVHTVKTT